MTLRENCHDVYFANASSVCQIFKFDDIGFRLQGTPERGSDAFRIKLDEASEGCDCRYHGSPRNIPQVNWKKCHADERYEGVVRSMLENLPKLMGK